MIGISLFSGVGGLDLAAESAGMGAEQFGYEPTRTCGKIPNRAKRLKALGNAVVPQQAAPLFLAISEMEVCE